MLRRAALTLGLLLALAPSAQAATESEPNADIHHANGPLAPDTDYTGEFQAAQDHDRFVFYANPGQEVNVSVEHLGQGPCPLGSFKARLLNADGRLIDDDDVLARDPDLVRFRQTPAAPARYYVLLDDDCAGTTYRLRVGPAAAVTTDSPVAQSQPRVGAAATGEPNDTVIHAWGPLAGGTLYGGTTNSPGDEDWYVLYSNPNQPVDVAVTKVGAGCSSTIDVRLYDANGDSLRGTATQNNITDHLAIAATAFPARYYLQLYDTCAGDEYQLFVSPAGAVSTTSPLLATQPRPGASPMREPDDSLDRAMGPLRGGTFYEGDFGTPGDVDHAYLYTSGPGPIDVAVTKAGKGCSSSLSARVSDPAGALVDSGGPASNRTAHLNFTVPRQTAYVLRLNTGCAGDPYQFRIDPPEALTTTPPALLAVAPRRDRKPPYKFTVSGSLLGKLGFGRSPICRGGTVRVRLKAKKRQVYERKVSLLPDCAWSAPLTIKAKRHVRVAKRAKRLTVEVRFLGRPELEKVRLKKTTVKTR